jgi:hypothetical protein
MEAPISAAVKSYAESPGSRRSAFVLVLVLEKWGRGMASVGVRRLVRSPNDGSRVSSNRLQRLA